MKSGIWTTEFWLTFGVFLIGALTQFGLISATDVATVTDGWSKTVNSIFNLVLVSGSVLGYLRSRHILKSKVVSNG